MPNDLAHLAQLLHFDQGALENAIGPTWWLDSKYHHVTDNYFFRGSEKTNSKDAKEDLVEPVVGIKVDEFSVVTVGRAIGVWLSLSTVAFEIEPLRQFVNSRDLSVTELSQAVQAAEISYISHLIECKLCKAPWPPYYVNEDGNCYGCGEERLGIVY